MSGPTVQYGRNVAAKHFYWWCPTCETYGLEERLSFAVVAGRQHKAVTHG
jgi:hypothetical protein